MKSSSLWKWLIIVIIIIIIIGGVIIIIIRVPIPQPPPCLVCGLNAIRLLGITEILLGVISLGLINKLRNTQRIN